MFKCRLCQQTCNNLTNIYNSRMKSLTQIILKLKGFKDSWNTNDLALCDLCIKGVENVALFWEHIPEAKKENSIPTDVFEEQELQTFNASIRPQTPLPAITSAVQEETNCGPSISTDIKREPIKIRLKLPRKGKREEISSCVIATPKEDAKQKRVRRCPKRFEDFQLTLNDNASESSKNAMKAKPCDEISFNSLPQIALLRLDNGQIIGTVAESERKGNIRISCHVCSEIFRVEKKFQKHIKTHFPKESELNQNVLKIYSFHCKLCNKAFNEYRAVRRHHKFAHTEERPFKCLCCDASFKYQFNLKYHMSTKHVPKKRFECTFCSKKFCMRYELKIHVRTHTKERPYKCEFCTFASAHKSNLKTHLKVNHLENFNTNGVTILKELFKPPDELIEQEADILYDLNASQVSDSTESKEAAVAKDLPNLNETFLEPDKLSQYDLNDANVAYTTEVPSQSVQVNLTESISVLKNDQHYCPKENISEEQFKSPQKVDQEESLFQFDVNDKNITETILTTFENYVENLEEENKNLVNESEIPSETHIHTEVETNKKDNVILRAIKNESSEEFLGPQANLNFFQLDSSLLKVLPSTSLLGLKKWPKFFQSTPNKDMQLVKSSTVFGNEKLNNLEKENIDCEKQSEHVQNISSDSSTALMKYKRTSQENQNFEKSQQSASNFKNLELPHTFKDTNSFQSERSYKDTTSDSTLKPSENISNLEEKSFIELNNNKTQNASPNYTNNLQICKEIKVSSRPIKIKKILPSKQSNESYKKSTTKETNDYSAKTKHNSSQEILNPNISLNSFKSSSDPTNRSLLKSVVKNAQSTTLSVTNYNGSNQTMLPYKPLITKIEILPPLKSLTNLCTESTNLIKAPSDNKFQCPHCYKYFKQKSPLTKHLRTHTGEKPYKCNLCPKAYADPSNYKKHKILHRNAAEALNINRTAASAATYAVQSSPAYSTVSDPDPDGIEAMQTLKKFESSLTADDDEMDENSSTSSSNMETQMWSDALDQALNSEEMKEQIRRNLFGINNAIMPKSMQYMANTIEHFSTEDPD